MFAGILSPSVWRDWDRGHSHHLARWRRVRTEYLAEMLLFLMENLLLLIPLLHTCAQILCRARTLPTSLPEEEDLARMCKGLLTMPLFILILALLQCKLFDLYNRKGHPWSRLLNDRQILIQ